MDTPEQPLKPKKRKRLVGPRGRPRSSPDEKQSNPVTVRLTNSELARLVREEAVYNLSRGEILRSVWFGTPPENRVRPLPTPEEIWERCQLVGMAGNLNQLVKRNNLGQDVQAEVERLLVLFSRIISAF